MGESVPTAALILALVAVTTLIADRIVTPAPVLQTAVGVALGFIPAFPKIQLEPRFVLLAVLPPLVYSSAVQLPWREFRANLRPIASLALGLVACTTGAIALVAHAVVPGFSWSAAFTLGAIVSPTDPVAATAVASRLGVPNRLTTIIEGEGLVNDAIALTIFGIAATALVGGSFSIENGLLKFAAILVGEITYGVVLGWIIAQIRRRIADARVEIAVSLLTPFLAYLPPEALGGSGVLAAVAAGMYIGEVTPELVPSGTRLHLTGVWDFIVYALNGTLFLLTGLQFRAVWSGAEGLPATNLWESGLAVAVVLIATRFAWTWTAAWIVPAVGSALGRQMDTPSNRGVTFIAWSGLRGGISLAAALSVPHEASSRIVILFLTACAIAATLLVQGTTLPFVIRLLRLQPEAEEERKQARQGELRARLAAARAALETVRSAGAAAEHLVTYYEHRVERLQDMKAHERPGASAHNHEHELKLQKRALEVERSCVLDLYRRGDLGDEGLHRIERELDLEEEQLGERMPALE